MRVPSDAHARGVKNVTVYNSVTGALLQSQSDTVSGGKGTPGTRKAMDNRTSQRNKGGGGGNPFVTSWCAMTEQRRRRLFKCKLWWGFFFFCFSFLIFGSKKNVGGIDRDREKERGKVKCRNIIYRLVDRCSFFSSYS